MQAQNEAIVANVSSLQTEMQVMKPTKNIDRPSSKGGNNDRKTTERNYRIEVLFHEKQPHNKFRQERPLPSETDRKHIKPREEISFGMR